MKKMIISFLSVFVFASLVYAIAGNISYPVPELGNCQSQQDCDTYCSSVDHMESCITYAEAHGLMTQEEITKARTILPLLVSGQTPGGCQSEQACNDYCNNQNNLNECVDFAVRIGEMSAEEAQIVKSTGGRGPGNCNSDSACKSYCQDSSHTEECINFALQHGLMSQEEADTIRKTGLGPGPGGCEGKPECENYCNAPEHQIECLQFGKDHGLIDAEEADLAIAAGGTDRETFDRFCNQNLENWQRCTDLWVKKGAMTQSDADRSILRRTVPTIGGCNAEDEACLNAYCSQDANALECWKYDRDTGHLSEEEYQQMVARYYADIAEKERMALLTTATTMPETTMGEGMETTETTTGGAETTVGTETTVETTIETTTPTTEATVPETTTAAETPS